MDHQSAMPFFSLPNSRPQLSEAFNIPTLAIPFLTALALICIQIVHGLVISLKKQRQNAPPCETEEEPAHAIDWIRHRMESLGGQTIFMYAVARLLGCLALVAMSLSTRNRTIPNLRSDASDNDLWQILMELSPYWLPFTFGYSALLAVVSLMVKKWSTLATRYNIILLLVTFGTYAYRDIWPLGTFSQTPKDAAESLLWVKITVLFVTAVIIPLFVPRRYVPVDPKDPMPVLNEEQTCSLFALAVYTYLDPIIFLGARVTHLRFDQLPPLQDTDYAKNLTRQAFPHLDTFQGAPSRRHLVFGLIRVFYKEFATLALLILCQAVALFAAPIGVYHILSYLETHGRGADSDIKPWVWIVCMFLGAATRSLAFQWYIFINTRTLVRCEAIIIQLVFEHSLRIRLKAESSDKESGGETAADIPAKATVPDTASVAESSATGSSTEDAGSETTSTAVSREVSTSSASTQIGSRIRADKKKDGQLKDKKKDNKAKKDQNLLGKLNNLITTDLSNITEARDFLMLVLFVPLQICLCTVFLYQVLGWSAFVGLAAMILLFPIPGYVAKLTQEVQRSRIKVTDARVQHVTEAIGVIRMIKLFGWEKKMSDRIDEKRKDELRWLWKLKTLGAINAVLNFVIPSICMVVSYATYTVVMKQELNASKIFSSISVFSMLRVQLNRISWQISSIIQGKVSIERVQEFLRDTELLDSFADRPEDTPEVPIPDEKQALIGFNNATFSWSSESNDGSLTPSSRNFRLHVDGEMIFKPNCVNLIVGPTGCGKTSMLMALLGEMHFIPSSVDSWFNLPRSGGVAYAAQESWVQNETIRENILFGSPYDETRYRKVVEQCSLDQDLEMFDAGDQTEVGEKGLTLSGGQKARITLARAIYSPAKIILLDDVLAALDVHTSTAIVNKCFKGDLLKGRTVLLVTHNLALTTPIAGFIVSIGLDGSVVTQGKDIEDALQHNPQLAATVKEQEETNMSTIDENAPAEVPTKVQAAHGKLTVAEEISEGRVTWRSMKLFLSALGGDYPLIYFSLWISGFTLTDWANTFQIWFLGYWALQYETHPPSEVNVFYYLGQYTGILFTAIIVYTSSYLLFLHGSMRAARNINRSLVNSILGGTLRWLDETPTGRMIARCTQDIQAVDSSIPGSLSALTEIGMSLITKIGIIVIFTPVFLAPGMAVAALGFYMGNLYLKAQLSVKREMSNARSPLLAHFSAATAGIVSVRAYGAASAFKQESLKRIDHYVRIARMSYNLNRWISVRIDLVGALFTVALATYLVYGGHNIGASNTGFTLNMCIDFCTLILWWVRIFNQFEVESNSLERIQHYLDIDHEPKPTEEGRPPAAWPTSGDLRVENLSARYSQTGPKVLHNLSFHIKSGERVGVVGRTGSGKSSLTLSLLRCIITEGAVYFDGFDTSLLNLDALRSNITIIPQTPELISGTLRRNLDPFEEHDDSTLNAALRDAGLFALQEELDESQITLDSNIATGGGNLSVGQRQILALARAMVRGSKLLILDEATSAIDYKTDAIIQTTLRNRLGSGVTVITVAHRLQTIMDSDKIMVLDAGNIVEFDTPSTLLGKDDGVLKSMVDGSGDRTLLYTMAGGGEPMKG